MSSKPETVYIKSVDRLLPPLLHKEKMNNPYRGGTADKWYSGLYNDLWVEYKWLPRVPKSAFIPGCSPLQIQWLRERYSEGRNVAVVVGCPVGAMLFRDRTWELSTEPAFDLTRQQVATWIERQTCPN